MDLVYECKSRYTATNAPTLEQTTHEKCMKLILVTEVFCTLTRIFVVFPCTFILKYNLSMRSEQNAVVFLYTKTF